MIHASYPPKKKSDTKRHVGVPFVWLSTQPFAHTSWCDESLVMHNRDARSVYDRLAKCARGYPSTHSY